jgi:Flp pilus assembly pilin Flp
MNKAARARHRRVRRPPRSRTAGQAYVEYVLIVLLIVVALIGGDHSVMAQLLAAFKSFYSAYSYALSMP